MAENGSAIRVKLNDSNTIYILPVYWSMNQLSRGIRRRKGSFGTQSTQGSQFVATMMPVVATLKQQHRKVLAYMTEAGQVSYTAMPAPSLLPHHTETEEDLPSVA